MDEDRVMPLGMLPSQTVCFLGTYLVCGTLLGAVYFGGLWWNTRLFASGASLTTTVALMLVRFSLLATVLTWAGRQGMVPLLGMAIGIMIARSLAVRGVRRFAP